MTTFDERIKRAADRYADGLQKAGLQPNDTLTRAMAEWAYREAREEGIKELYEQHTRNIDAILEEHKRDMNEIKRSGARLRLSTCPPIALLFGLIAWYNFNLVQTHPEAFFMGIVFAIGSAAFLAMLVGGAIFELADRDRGGQTK